MNISHPAQHDAMIHMDPTRISGQIKIVQRPRKKIQRSIDYYSLPRKLVPISKRNLKRVSFKSSIFCSSELQKKAQIDCETAYTPSLSPQLLRKTVGLIQPRVSLLSSQQSINSLLRMNDNIQRKSRYQSESNNNYLQKYTILREIGQGSFSIVYLAKRNQTDNIRLNNEDHNNQQTQQQQPQLQNYPKHQLVAIKVHQKFKINSNTSKFQTIRKQINILHNINHPGIIKLIESVQSLTRISLIFEYIGTQSLLDFIKKNHPLPDDKLRDICLQIANAMEYLHNKGIVHRDIKLQNILIDGGRIKLIDFGFSCISNPARKLNTICGTPNYMAPQVISRKEYVGEAADIWAYGVVVFALAEGRLPFKADCYRELEKLVCRGKFTFKHPNRPLQDFLKRILKVQAIERPRAKQLLSLKWLLN